jgi:predicted negative regulator of RcsB-dependent stress response
MATASKRITRKQLRQPDWFQVTTDKALHLFAENRTKVFAGLAGLAVILLIIAGWQIFKARQNAAAGQEFGSALSLYQAQKYKEAISELHKVEGYRWSRYASLAYLYEANSHLALGDFDKALASAERFLAATGPDTLYRQIALITIASVEERQKKCKEAIVRYDEAEKINRAFQLEAILGRGRCAEQIGDIKKAIASYKDYVNENPDSWVNLRLAELEAQNKTPTSAKLDKKTSDKK